MRDYSKLDKLGRGSRFSPDHRHIPFTKVTYAKEGNKWVEDDRDEGLTSESIARESLAKGLPGQSRLVRKKKDRFGSFEKYDTATSYNADKTKKSVLSVDWAKGKENYRKLADKAYYDRQRYYKKKAEKDK